MSAKPTKPKFEATDERRQVVEAMTGGGTTQAELARIFDIDEKTLRKHFREELDGGVTRANAAVAGGLFHNAVVKLNVTAQIFWLKTRAGWKETQVFEGPGGLPLSGGAPLITVSFEGVDDGDGTPGQ